MPNDRPPALLRGAAQRWLAPCVAFVAAFAVYLRTLHPGLAGPDSGEFVTVAKVLGVAHPPGYPLYTLLAHAFGAVVAIGTYAWRLNLLSAVLQATAAAIVCATVQRLTGRALAGLAAALALAFARAWWKSALVAEVFPLNDLMAAILWFAFATLLRDAGLLANADVDAASPRRAWPLTVVVLVTAAIPAHHHSLVLLALPTDAVTLALLVVPERALVRWLPGFRRPYTAGSRDVGVALALALVALAPLAYLPIAAARHTAMNWSDPETPSRFVAHLLRAEYGTLSMAAPRPDLAGHTDHAALYLKSVLAQFGWPAAVLAIVGLAMLVAANVGAPARERWHAARRPLALVVFGIVVLQALFFRRVPFAAELPYYLGVVERFYPLAHLSVAVVAGVGASALLGAVPSRARALAGCALVAAAAAAPFASHFATVDQRGNTFMADLCHDVLASLPPHAVVFTTGDEFYDGLGYEQFVEGRRPDVTVVDQFLLTRPWYVHELRRRDPGVLPPFTYAAAADSDYAHADSLGDNVRWIDHLAGHRPVAFIGTLDDSYESRYELVRRGHIALAYPRGAAPSAAARARDAALLLDSLQIDSWFRPQDPLSSEANNHPRVTETVASFCFLLAAPDGHGVRRSAYPGLARLASFLDRFERVPVADPVLLRAAGYLRCLHPDFLDLDRAAADLERYLASGATGPEADQARELLARLGAARHR